MKYKPNKSSKSSNFRMNRRLIQEYGFEEAKRIGSLDSEEEQKIKRKNTKKQSKIRKKKEKQQSKKTRKHIGDTHQLKYKEFLSNGGDPNACPFD